MNRRIAQLSDYPFQRLTRLKAGVTPPANLPPIDLALGEPKHSTPTFVRETLVASLDSIQTYPVTRGLAELRTAVARWVERRYGLPDGSVDPESHVLPCNGSREALFSIAQAVIDPVPPVVSTPLVESPLPPAGVIARSEATKQSQIVVTSGEAPYGESGSRAKEAPPIVILPNPFYQIYEGAARLAGAEVYFVNAVEENGFSPNYGTIPEEILRRTQLLYVCSPSNPTGAVAGVKQYQHLIELALRYNFVIASDECYSEIYDATPPPGLLQAAYEMGNREFRNCVAFQSLSKRSSMPGARTGFVAGDAAILKDYGKLRIYTGGATPYFIQKAAAAAWADEAHVDENRRLYREKIDRVLEILGPVLKVVRPAAGFYLWPETGDGETFTRDLFREQNVTVLPGAYLGREAHGVNPGQSRVRIALVASVADCTEAARRIRAFVTR
ncbi:MAG: aminotransferase class I/II-fold pyridoxal phosphate-dependent enzyme [Nitrospirae bacterium]|nr:aminotransferase class I/II-fold pyridoxal phosphate-dependent enzyme [Nitrospirota bacterium]